MSDNLFRTLFFTDSHYGKEYVGGSLRDVHDRRAHNVLLQIAADFRPTHIINGGDGLDCGAVSRHRKEEGPRATEGLRLQKDAERYRAEVLAPLEALKPKVLRYHLGNHEAWLEQLIDEHPGLEGALSVNSLLKLVAHGWDVWDVGTVSTVSGKLHYMHGDNVRGAAMCAKNAVIDYGRSVIFGHFHTSQRYTKHSAFDAKDIHRGFAIGCLCRKNPRYTKNQPNRFSQSFALVEEDSKTGQFQVNEIEISNGKAIYNGRIYKG